MPSIKLSWAFCSCHQTFLTLTWYTLQNAQCNSKQFQIFNYIFHSQLICRLFVIWICFSVCWCWLPLIVYQMFMFTAMLAPSQPIILNCSNNTHMKQIGILCPMTYKSISFWLSKMLSNRSFMMDSVWFHWIWLHLPRLVQNLNWSIERCKFYSNQFYFFEFLIQVLKTVSSYYLMLKATFLKWTFVSIYTGNELFIYSAQFQFENDFYMILCVATLCSMFFTIS